MQPRTSRGSAAFLETEWVEHCWVPCEPRAPGQERFSTPMCVTRLAVPCPQTPPSAHSDGQPLPKALAPLAVLVARLSGQLLVS